LSGGRAAGDGNDEIFFFGKMTHVFGGHVPTKSGEELIFEEIFLIDFDKKTRNFLGDKGGNDRKRER
jgi:hypothetical protein